MEPKDGKRIFVPLEIGGIKRIQTKSLETQPHIVNRVLLLPFKKIDESIPTNEEDNFNLDQTSLKQVEIKESPTFLTMLELEQGSTYTIFAIGYGNNDYNINDADQDRKFDLSYSVPDILQTLYLQSVSATDVSGFFSAIGISHDNVLEIGKYFKPEGIKTIKVNLTRSVSGLSLEIRNIPSSVTSITLIAEKLVQSVFLTDLEFLHVVSEIENEALKTFSTQIPDVGSVSFDHYLLPTFSVNRTRFYLDVQSGIFTERFLMKVNDVAGISSNNSISFYPNQLVKISGDYSNIDIGFTLDYSINLDDDDWDGIQ
ncbi:MAG: hypothetical protein GX963_06635 [Bacteroidales bacterium]|nr:hypothetical protein [Bacteroidales bacterium]